RGAAALSDIAVAVAVAARHSAGRALRTFGARTGAAAPDPEDTRDHCDHRQTNRHAHVRTSDVGARTVAGSSTGASPHRVSRSSRRRFALVTGVTTRCAISR